MSPSEMPDAPYAALNTSDGARCFIADFFATELRRHDFAGYIHTHLAADFACALAQHLATTGKQQVGEVQGGALYIEWLKERISSIHSTVSLGHQTGPHAYAGEDFGRYLAEAAGDCRKIMRVLSDLAARPPVTQDPNPIYQLQKADGSWIDQSKHSYDYNVAQGHSADLRVVYTAPPAQGIDLGPVRELLRRRMAQWRSHLPSDPGAPGTVAISGDGEGGYNNDVRMYREGIALMDQVMALIDGQRDAAPGPRISQGTHDPSGVGNG